MEEGDEEEEDEDEEDEERVQGQEEATSVTDRRGGATRPASPVADSDQQELIDGFVYMATMYVSKDEPIAAIQAIESALETFQLNPQLVELLAKLKRDHPTATKAEDTSAK